MKNKVLALAVAVAIIATGCSGSAQVEVAENATSSSSADVGSDRETVDAVEPTAEAATSNAPPADPAGDPAAGAQADETDNEATENDAADEEGRDDSVPISPEAPLPAERLCTTNVDETEQLNLRKDPSIDAPIVFGIPGGTCRMRVLTAAADGWVRVVYETQNISVVGYVSTDFAAEDLARTRALNWFERVVAEQDTSDIAVQEMIDEWIDFHPFPAAAFTVVPFDIGAATDCHEMDFGVTGCPVHVRDSGGSLIAPMVIQTQLVPADGGASEVKVTGFDLCFGTEDCEVADFSRHDRIVVDHTQTLAGVPIGSDAEEAIEALIAVFGTPTVDTGWIVGCPLDGDTERNERYVGWGSLSTGFRQFDNDQSGPYFHDWNYGLDDQAQADPAGPQPWEIRLHDAALGMNITEAAYSTGADQFVNELLQVQQLRVEAWTLYGQGLETDTRINVVAVPFVPICD